jgi:hypothetical protein
MTARRIIGAVQRKSANQAMIESVGQMGETGREEQACTGRTI